MEKPATLWLPTTSNLHPHVITGDTGVKISEIAGNPAGCTLQSWSTERHCITMDRISGEGHTMNSLPSQDTYIVFYILKLYF